MSDLPKNDTPLNVRVPRDLREWVDAYAGRMRVDRSKAVRILLEAARDLDRAGQLR